MKTKLKTETYRLPAHWASYLINGDGSAFSLYDDGDAELQAIDRWTEANNLGFCIDCTNEAEFRWRNDGPTGHLGGDCLDYVFEVIQKA